MLTVSSKKIENPPINNYINERNRLGATPLWLAAVAGHSEAMKTLIENGAA